MNKYLIALLAALALLLAACGEDSEEDADGESTDTTVAVTDEPDETDSADQSDDSAASDGDETDDAAGPDDGDDADSGETDSDSDEGAMSDSADDETTDDGDFGGADAEVGDFISSFFAQSGAEVTPEILDCLADRDVDAGLSMLEASEEDLNLAGLGLFACAPNELAPAISFDITPPDGTDTADVECVVAETFRYVGTLPTEQALEALDSVDIPEEIREGIQPIAEDVCGLDSDVVEEILTAT